MDEVLARALVRKPEAITWEEPAAKPVAETIEEDASGLTAH
jgi:ATP-dependent Lon protease